MDGRSNAAGGGESSKMFTITSQTDYGYPTEAAAGEYLISTSTFSVVDQHPLVTTDSGKSWYAWADNSATARVPEHPAAFVMPSENVTIS